MVNLEFLISCSSPRGTRTQIKAWIDALPERGFEAEYELPLETLSESTRRAQVALEPAASYLIYRVGVVADPRAVWSVSIKDLGSGRLLHEDSDLLALPKGYLVGSCNLPYGH